MIYTAPLKIRDMVLNYQTDDFEHYVDLCMCMQISINMFAGEKDAVKYNIYFPVFLAEISKLLLAEKDALKIMDFCKRSEVIFYEKLHTDVEAMLGSRQDWFKGSQDVRNAVKERILSKKKKDVET